MKTNKIIQITLLKGILLLSSIFCFNLAIAQPNYYFYPDQKLHGDNDARLVFYSNHNTISSMKFLDKDQTRYGSVYGSNNGAFFGLLDGNSKWSYLAAKDDYTAFRINNIEMMRIEDNGNVGIGTTTPQHELDVCGVIRANEVLVEDNWCDFVFEPEYCITTLEEEADFIKMYGHLSNFESAEEMDGMINVNDIFKRQQIQIEENVLHLIEMNEENEVLQIQVDDLTDEVNQLNEKVSTLTVNYEALAKELAVIKKQLR